jgi:SAM-dependent methyltransferase
MGEDSLTTAVDPYVQQAVVKTCGNLYRGITLHRYPIPELPLPDGNGARLLDVGCNWGRWSIAATRKGYDVTGIDPRADAVEAARRVARALGADSHYVVADARRLPFEDASFDVVFSYSVLQHLSKDDARSALHEAARVLGGGGTALVQLPNAFGPRNVLQQALRGFRSARGFEVRYWTPGELARTFEEIVGPAELEIDGFFSLNAQITDVDLLPARSRLVVRLSQRLRRFPWLLPLADSLYVRALKR